MGCSTMAKSKLTPLERAACAWILQLKPEWVEFNLAELSATHNEGLLRVVRGGFVECRMPVRLKMPGLGHDLHSIWRVSGPFSKDLEQQLRRYVNALGHSDKGFVMICGYPVAARLTSDGELAQREFHGDHEWPNPTNEAGLPTHILNLITGGPDGSEGIPALGKARLDGDFSSRRSPRPRTAKPRSKPKRARTQPSLTTAVQDIAVAIREAKPSGQDVPQSGIGSSPPAATNNRTTSPATDDKFLSPGEQADQLLGPHTASGRDRTSRLQTTAKIRKRALDCGFLVKSDITSRGRNRGEFVRGSAWVLPVAYYKAIRNAAGNDKRAAGIFPAHAVGQYEEWMFCRDCLTTFAAGGATDSCTQCRSTNLQTFARRRRP